MLSSWRCQILWKKWQKNPPTNDFDSKWDWSESSWMQTWPPPGTGTLGSDVVCSLTGPVFDVGDMGRCPGHQRGRGWGVGGSNQGGKRTGTAPGHWHHVKSLQSEAPLGADELSADEAEGQKDKKLNSAASVWLLSLLVRCDSLFSVGRGVNAMMQTCGRSEDYDPLFQLVVKGWNCDHRRSTPSVQTLHSGLPRSRCLRGKRVSTVSSRNFVFLSLVQTVANFFIYQ